MKRFICVMLLALSVGLLCSSCSKEEDENTFEIINASGISLYDCTVSFRNAKDGDIVDSQKVGSILADQTVKVKKLGYFIVISGKNQNGNPVISKTLLVLDKMHLYKSDLY